MRNLHYPPAKSFVVRGRKTKSQEKALQELWPLYGIDVGQEPLDLNAVFGRCAPKMLEIGFGNGENLCDLATRLVDKDFIGIEVHPAGVGRVLGTVHEQGIQNVRVVQHDAIEVCDNMFFPQTFDEILIYFSDPWPKKRQEHRRLIQVPFVKMLVRILAEGGSLRFATDWEPYAKYAMNVFESYPELENVAGTNQFSPRCADRMLTKFESRGMRLGHSIFDIHLQKVSEF